MQERADIFNERMHAFPSECERMCTYSNRMRNVFARIQLECRLHKCPRKRIRIAQVRHGICVASFPAIFKWKWQECGTSTTADVCIYMHLLTYYCMMYLHGLMYWHGFINLLSLTCISWHIIAWCIYMYLLTYYHWHVFIDTLYRMMLTLCVVAGMSSPSCWYALFPHANTSPASEAQQNCYSNISALANTSPESYTQQHRYSKIFDHTACHSHGRLSRLKSMHMRINPCISLWSRHSTYDCMVQHMAAWFSIWLHESDLAAFWWRHRYSSL